MARKPSPWWWYAREGWYVNLAGRRERLGPHPEGAPAPKKSPRTGLWNAPRPVEEAFRKLLDGEAGSAPRAKRSLGPDEAQDQDQDRVADVLDDFLAWCSENRDASTTERYRRFLQDFVLGGNGKLPIGSLTSKHVTAWLAARPTWNSTTKRNGIVAVQRALNWACKNRGLEKNPLAGMEKPEARRRSGVVLPADFDYLMGRVKDQAFRDLLAVSWDCGARPQEVKRLEARHFDESRSRAVLPAEEAKGRHRPRTIYFPTERCMEIVRRLSALHPAGPLFRNAKGNAWTAYAVHCRFRSLEVSTGLARMTEKGIASEVADEAVEALATKLDPVRQQRQTGRPVAKTRKELLNEARRKLVAAEARKHGVRLSHYQFRRTWITSKLIAGVDSHVVAKLAGHQTTDMIDKHYSQVADDAEFMLREAARKIEPKKA